MIGPSIIWQPDGEQHVPALAVVITQHRHCPCCSTRCACGHEADSPRAVDLHIAHTILASDWLRERDEAARQEGRDEVVAGATIEWGYRNTGPEPIERWPQLPEDVLRRVESWHPGYELIYRMRTATRVAAAREQAPK